MSLSAGPLERRSMSDEAYVRLREAIIDGELAPGERLRDYELAERLGTSKTPIRHALDRLADQGLVEMQRNRYTRVAPLDLDRVRSAMDILGDVWIGSVRHVVRGLEDDDIAYLVEIMDAMSAAIEARDITDVGMSARDAAIAFARLEGNDARAIVIDLVTAQTQRFSPYTRHTSDWEALGAFAQGLRQAIRQRDAIQTRAVLVTLFDDVIPATIDRAAAEGVGASESG